MRHQNKFAGLNAHHRSTRQQLLAERLFAAFISGNKHWHFVTLTYSKANLPAGFSGINLQALSNVRDTTWDDFRLDRKAWIAKLRRKFGKGLTFHIAMELTQKRVPHIHAFIGTAKRISNRQIKATWNKGSLKDCQHIFWPTASCLDAGRNKSAWQHATDFAAYVKKQHDKSFSMHASSSRDFTTPPVLAGKLADVLQHLTLAQIEDLRNMPNTEPFALVFKHLLEAEHPKAVADKYAMRRHKDGKLDWDDFVEPAVPLKDQAGPVKVMMLGIKQAATKEGWK